MCSAQGNSINRYSFSCDNTSDSGMRYFTTGKRFSLAIYASRHCLWRYGTWMTVVGQGRRRSFPQKVLEECIEDICKRHLLANTVSKPWWARTESWSYGRSP